jgi:hypothetical protein
MSDDEPTTAFCNCRHTAASYMLAFKLKEWLTKLERKDQDEHERNSTDGNYHPGGVH